MAVVVGVVAVGAVGYRSLAEEPSASSFPSLAAASSSTPPPRSSVTSTVAAASVVPRLPDPAPGDHQGAVGEADGVVSGDVSVFDDRVPAVVRLDPALLAALRRAGTDAADDGVRLYVNSGWRSPAYQEQLLHAAISKYGSEQEAARWVATPETSEHVSGDAVDVGHPDAAAWLSGNGARYGLCRVYANEPWHFELRPDAAADGCPAGYADPTQDPRMQR